jgi:alpha-maltose-1-phosphate synthase
LKVLLAHPGTQYSFQLAKQLHRKGILLEFQTGIAFGKDSLVFKICSLLPASLYRKLSNRFVDGVPDHYIRRNITNELRALMRLKLGKDQEMTLFHRNEKFQRSIGEESLKNADVVISFDTSSWILAERCRKRGIPLFLDVSIAHPLSKEKVYKRVSEIYPEFAHGLKPKPDDLIAREQSEIGNSTHIVVASTFSYNSYVQNGLDPLKMSIIPYGVDASAFRPADDKPSEIIHFVFVGLVDAR